MIEKKPEAAPVEFLREFNSAGPCITLGQVIGRTPKSVKFLATVWEGGKMVKRPKRRGGHRLALGLLHTEPCPSCMDHPRTQYPDGYWD